MKKIKTLTMKGALYFLMLGSCSVLLNGCTYHVVKKYKIQHFSTSKWENLDSKILKRNGNSIRYRYADDNGINSKKEFIIRCGLEWWTATQFRFHEDSISFSACKILTSEIYDISTAEKRKTRRVKIGEGGIFHRVKISVSPEGAIDEGNNIVSLTNIEEIAIYKHNPTREILLYTGLFFVGAILMEYISEGELAYY